MASVSRGSSMRGGRGRRSMSEINVVPYIDVMLVLLVIFMVTAPLVTPGTVDVPTVGKSSNAPSSYIQIELKLDGTMNVKVVGGSSPSTQNVTSVDAIVPIVQREQERDASNPAPVIIAADKSIQYDKVMQVMSKLQSASVKRVGLSVKPSPPEK
jgi:biopolymer transport protein TolR